MAYTTLKIESGHLTNDIIRNFFVDSAVEMNEAYGERYDLKNFNLRDYADRNRVIMCLRDGEPVGFMLSRLFSSLFDKKSKILYQDLLHAKTGTRAAHILMRDFIDFGKQNANHIISAIGEHTNIKGRSLEKLGFKKLEEQYCIEV